MRNGRLIYVADAMCSWCWGFAPSMDALLTSDPSIELEVIPGGLRPGPAAQRMGDGLAGYLSRTWAEVARRSGQAFNESWLQRDDFLYDTDPPARAQLAYAATTAGEQYRFLRALQSAFYAEGRDITDSEVLVEIAESQGVPRSAFVTQLKRAETGLATYEAYARARRLGVSGFPTVLLKTPARVATLTAGWVAPQALLAAYQDALT